MTSGRRKLLEFLSNNFLNVVAKVVTSSAELGVRQCEGCGIAASEAVAGSVRQCFINFGCLGDEFITSRPWVADEDTEDVVSYAAHEAL